MEFTAKQIAAFVEGRIEGDENATVSTFTKIEEGAPGAISFLANPKYTHFIYETAASIVLVSEDVEIDKPVKATLIRVKDARDCVARLLQMYEASKTKKSVLIPLHLFLLRPKLEKMSISEHLPSLAMGPLWVTEAKFIPTPISAMALKSVHSVLFTPM